MLGIPVPSFCTATTVSCGSLFYNNYPQKVLHLYSVSMTNKFVLIARHPLGHGVKD